MITIVELKKQPSIKQMLMNIANNNMKGIEEFSITKDDEGQDIITFILEKGNKNE